MMKILLKWLPFGALLVLVLLSVSCSNSLRRERTVDVSIEKAWRVLAEDFAEVSQWARAIPVSSATAEGEKPPGAPVTGRVCSTDLGTVTETLVVFDPEQRTFAYEARVDSMPFFVGGLRNQWTLTALGPEQTRIEMNLEARLWPFFNVIMWPAMRGKMAQPIDETLEDLEYFLENDRPSPEAVLAAIPPKEAQPR